MADSETSGKAWWQTLPGVLTATAAIITALTGLLVALGGLGVFHRSSKPQSQPATESSQDAAREGITTRKPELTQNTASNEYLHHVPLPSITQVQSGSSTYRLLSVDTAPYSPGKTSLRFTIRMINNGSNQANFWSASFRLRVGDSLQAPVNLLDELVASNSSKDGTVEFVIRSDTSMVGFQMGDVGTDKPDISIHLNGS